MSVSAFEAPGEEVTARGPLAALYRRLRGWLERPRADRVVLWLGFLLLLPSLDTGLAADDYLHTIMLDRPSPIEGFRRAPLDIFRFCDPRDAPALLRQGLLSWWDDPQTRLAFLRPISAATHVFDHTFFRNQGMVMHLHSALWVLLLLAGVRALYRELIADRLLANLAFALYALDDARGWLVSWVAARNAAVATALSVWTLVVHVRERRGQLRSKGLLGPLLLTCALLAGEGSLSTCAYLLGFALWLDSGALRARLLRLWPYVMVVIVWRVVYRALGYRVYGSSLYVDPQSDPVAYLHMLVTNAPILLGSQFGGMWSDLWTLLFVAPLLRAAVYVASLSFVAYVFALLWRRVRDNPVLRMCSLGALCSVAPASATAPSDRLLPWIAIGASVLLAALLSPLLRGRAPAALGQRVTLPVLLALHLIGVVFLPSRARANLLMRDWFGRAGAAIPRAPSITRKTLIYVNPPLLPFAAYLPIERAGQGVARPGAQHILASATTALTIDRLDAHTLRLRPERGFLLDPASKLMWSPHRPFTPGEEIVQGDMRVRVVRVTADRRPLEVEMRFAHPLEDPRYVWCQWRGVRSVPFAPPKVGQRVVLPPADYIEAVLGKRLALRATF